MISGDDPKTVASLAKLAGIEGSEQYVDVSQCDESMDVLASNYTIFGRVRPEEKKQLVCAMQKQGKIVLMSGDGVNDVPALKVKMFQFPLKTLQVLRKIQRISFLWTMIFLRFLRLSMKAEE